MFIVPSSMLATVSALSSQNLGAGKPERAAQTLKYATMIATGYGIAVVLVIELVAEPLLGCFTTDAAVVLMAASTSAVILWIPFLPGSTSALPGILPPAASLTSAFSTTSSLLCWCAFRGPTWLPGCLPEPAAYGAGRTGGFAVIRHDLRGGLPLDEAPRHPVYCRLTFP